MRRHDKLKIFKHHKQNFIEWKRTDNILSQLF